MSEGRDSTEPIKEFLSREDIVLVQAEIKELLLRFFRGTPLESIFTEPIPADIVEQLVPGISVIPVFVHKNQGNWVILPL